MTKDLSGRDRLVFALDVSSAGEARALVAELDGAVGYFKVGLELLVAGGFGEFLDELAAKKNVFLDLKLPGDIPETVTRAVRVATQRGSKLLTLSAAADAPTIRAAVAGRGASAHPKLLFVSYLSSQDASDYAAQGGRPEDLEKHVVERSRAALDAGCDGFVASGSFIATLRRAFPSAVIVAPGIRPAGAASNDHKRQTTPAQAIEMGADYLVVGRPIRDAADRRQAAARIVDEIDKALARRPSAGVRGA